MGAEATWTVDGWVTITSSTGGGGPTRITSAGLPDGRLKSLPLPLKSLDCLTAVVSSSLPAAGAVSLRFSVTDSPGAMAADAPLALLRNSTTVRPSASVRVTADHAAVLEEVLVETAGGVVDSSHVGPAGSVTSAEPNGSVLVLDPQGPQFVSVTETGVGAFAGAEVGLTLSA